MVTNNKKIDSEITPESIFQYGIYCEVIKQYCFNV